MPIIEAHAGAAEGVQLRTLRRRAVVTSAALLALNATPVEIVPAPGAGFALIFVGALIRKSAGTAYDGIAAGEDLSVKYTDESGLEVAQCETTGFLDQATNQIRWVAARAAATGNSAITPVENAALVLHMLTGEIATGDSDLEIEVHYRVVRTVP
jgi:hypothetical protein